MTGEGVRFSVIVPTYARPGRLATCVEACERLDQPADRVEIIVVDDGSPEPVAAPNASRAGPFRLRVIRQPNAGPAAARNAGARAAVGEYLAFTDDDCEPRPGWLSALSAQFDRTPHHLLGGRTENALPRNPFSASSQQLVAYLYEYYNREPGRARFFASNNMAVSRTLFEEVGGFDTTFPLAAGEDRELCDRWHAAGRGATYVPDAVVDHAHSLDLRSFLRQHFNYGRGAHSYHRARLGRQQDRAGPEPLTFYLDLLRYPLSQGDGMRAWYHATLMALTQFANTAGYLRERSRG